MIAQPCVRGTLTDPANPSSGTNAPSYGTNHFDWMTTTNPYKFNLHKPAPFTNDIDNPYYNTNPFTNLPIVNFASSDFKPEQGWELIKRDMGYFNDEASQITTSNKYFPYFILYNKYTGLLRIWADLGQMENMTQGVTVYLEFIGNGGPLNPDAHPSINFNISALLNHVNGKAQTLDKKTEVTKVNVTTNFPDNYNSFFYADFQMAYDVCTCVYESGLRVRFEKTMNSIFNANGRVLGTATSINDFSSNSTAPDYLSSVYQRKLDDSVKYFNQQYKDIQTLHDDLIIANNIANDYSNYYKGNIDLLHTALTVFAIATGVEEIKAGVEAASTVLDFFSSKVEDNSSSSSEPQPMVVQGEIALKGQVTTTKIDNDHWFNFTNPGSLNSETRPEFFGFDNNHNLDPNYKKPDYPIYNEVLGTFALLKKPIGDTANRLTKTWFPNEGQEHFKTSELSFKLNENLIYTYNPALNIVKEKTNITVALFFEVDNIISNSLFNVNYYNLTKVYSETRTDIVSTPLGNLSFVFSKDVLMTPYVPIECVSDLVANIKYIVNQSTNTLATLPFIAQQNSADNNSIYLFNSLKPHITKAYLKIMFVPEYQSRYSNIPNRHAAQLFTYDVDLDNNENDITAGKLLVPVNLDLTIPTTNYNKNTVIFAKHDIEITGDLTANSGVNVTIIAGNSINVKVGASITPEITLKIGGSMIECNTPINPVTNSSYLSNYCNRNSDIKYDANEELNKTASLENKPLTKPDKSLSSFNSMYLYPNPANSFCKISLSFEKSMDNVNIKLIDVSGNLVNQIVLNNNYPKGNNYEVINTDNLASGVYFININSSDGYSETKKLIIAK